MIRTRLTIIVVSFALVTTGCSKTTGIITVEEGDTTCKVDVHSAVVNYVITLAEARPDDTSYTVTVRSQEGREVLGRNSGVIPKGHTETVEPVTVNRPAFARFTDSAGVSIEFAISGPKKAGCVGE